MASTANSSDMTPRERHDGEALIKGIQAVIEGADPALAAWALVSALASLTSGCAADPKAQAHHLGRLLVATVESPPEAGSLN